jgi:hypothetical protein
VYRFTRTGRTDGWRQEFERRASAYRPEYREWHTRTVLLAEGDIEGLIDYLEQATPETASDAGARDFELGITYSAIGDSISAQPHLDLSRLPCRARPETCGRWLLAPSPSSFLVGVSRHFARRTRLRSD